MPASLLMAGHYEAEVVDTTGKTLGMMLFHATGTADPTYELWTLPDSQNTSYHNISTVPTRRPGASILTPLLMGSTGVLGNLIALTVLARARKTKVKSAFYKLVASLALTDLCGILFTTPVVMLVYTRQVKLYNGLPLCNYFSFVMIFAGTTTILILGVMAVERYFAVKHPFIYNVHMSNSRGKFIVLGIWLTAVIMAACPLLGFGSNVVQFPRTWCFFDFRGSKLSDQIFTYMFASIGLTVILVTIVCNITVVVSLVKVRRRLRKKPRRSRAASLSGTMPERNELVKFSDTNMEIQMIVLLIGILCVFVTCWSPLLIRIIINQAKLFPPNPAQDLIAIWLASLNQVLDPWVYILFRKEFLMQVIGILRCIFCCKRPPPAPEPTRPNNSVASVRNWKSERESTRSRVVRKTHDEMTLLCDCACRGNDDSPTGQRKPSLFSYYSTTNGRTMYESDINFSHLENTPKTLKRTANNESIRLCLLSTEGKSGSLIKSTESRVLTFKDCSDHGEGGDIAKNHSCPSTNFHTHKVDTSKSFGPVVEESECSAS